MRGWTLNATQGQSYSHKQTDPHWPENLPDAWKYYVRGLSHPMAKGPRALDPKKAFCALISK